MIKEFSAKTLKIAYPVTWKRLLKVRRGIKARCYNPNNISYHKYGAKGITVCNEWLDSKEAFVEWAINNGYPIRETSEPLSGKTASFDRIDTTKGYSPDNCRIISHAENSGLSRRGKTKYDKPISVYDIDGNFIEELDNYLQVRNKYGISLTHIQEILEPEHSRKSSKGYRLATYNVEKLKPLNRLSKKDYTKTLDVSLYTLGGSIVKTYSSIKEASKDTGIECRKISDVLDNKHPFTQNKRFRYGSNKSIEPLPVTQYKGLQSKYPTPIEMISTFDDREPIVVDYREDVMQLLSVTRETVNRALKGVRKTCGGYKIKYL